jgi:hypothetical protein
MAPPRNVGVAIAKCEHFDCTKLRHHDAQMRTTLTLDDDVVRLIEAEVRRRGSSTKQVINEAIRRGLTKPKRSGSKSVKHQVFSSRLAPGIDSRGLNRLVDELEVDAAIAKLARQ